MRITIRDVAQRTGFSITTVSHVLNDVPGKRVNSATRERIRKAAEELAYTPHRIAQGLRSQRTNTVGFLSDQIATTPHAGRLILGAQHAAAAHGALLLALDYGRQTELRERQIRALLDRQVDGIVYVWMFHQAVTLPAAAAAAPAVLVNARADTGGYASVVPDEKGGAVSAVRALIENGHRRIGFVTDQDRDAGAERRLAGYHTALVDAETVVNPALVVSDSSDAPGGYRAAARLLDQPKQSRPTALFCFNDRMAMGAYQAAADLGLSIPQDLSIVGFDNQEIIAAGLRPGLTTVELPHYAMGQWAVNALMTLINTTDEQPPRQATLPCPLVRRASVGPPPRS